MKIKRLYINNYKSLVDFELIEPNPFSVFVGPNAAGKSNIFEALEFLGFSDDLVLSNNIFGGHKNLLNKFLLSKYEHEKKISYQIKVILCSEIADTPDEIDIQARLSFEQAEGKIELIGINPRPLPDAEQGEFMYKLKVKEGLFRKSFSRIFIKNLDLVKIKTNGSDKLSIDAANLENVLFRILQDEAKQEEIIDWLQMLIPELDKVEVAKSDLSGDYFLRIFEKNLNEPIGKNLISDGTYNILALLTAVYQSDEPQFLCIEEPENGLNPYVIRELVGFFRQLCEEKGHYIWLNTHSPSLVKELQPKELILINKKDGKTKAKQLDKDLKFKSMPLDEAWLTNTLGGGLPW